MKSKIIIVCIVYFLLPFKAFAGYSLSVTPFEGSRDLDFGRITYSDTITKEVRLRITSDTGVQYQIWQRLLEPLENEQGVRLDLDALDSYTLRGSNSYGSLYQEAPFSLGNSDQLLYTSSTDGQSDSFMVVYTVKGNSLNASGRFSGRIYYTLRPVGALSQEEVILDVSLDASGEFRIETEGSSGRDIVRLDSRSAGEKEGYFKVYFKNNLDKVKVYQEISDPLRNELAEDINRGCVNFSISGGSNGEVYYKNISPLERRNVLIYSSENAEDAFFVNFSISKEKIESQNAGTYRGRINYIVEQNNSESFISLDIEVVINPVFQLDVVFPAEGLSFSDLLPNSPPQAKEVLVEVKTNLGRPYIVTQNMNYYLTNEKGEEIPSDFFTVKQEMEKENVGKISFSDFTPVALGDVPLFFSDSKGSSSKFKVVYRLRPYSGILPGNYSTTVNYSLGEK